MHGYCRAGTKSRYGNVRSVAAPIAEREEVPENESCPQRIPHEPRQHVHAASEIRHFARVVDLNQHDALGAATSQTSAGAETLVAQPQPESLRSLGLDRELLVPGRGRLTGAPPRGLREWTDRSKPFGVSLGFAITASAATFILIGRQARLHFAERLHGITNP